MHIHFVCAGNIYRGRLAETYLNSKQLPTISATTSGIEAHIHAQNIGIISWEAMRLIKNHHLASFMKPLPEWTTPLLLQQADIVVFMNEQYYQVAIDELGYDGQNYEVWEIPDISIEGNLHRILQSENTFACIQQKVDTLVEHLQAEQMKPTGQSK